MEFLVSNGANINAENLEGRSPIYSAISEGRKHIVDILLSGGANINTKDHYRLTPLHAAVMFGQPEILEILLSKGADTSTKDSNGKTPLEQAIILSKTNFRKGTVQEEEKWKFEECTKILQKYENK